MHGRRVQTPHLMYFPRPLLPLHPMQRRIPPIMRTTSSFRVHPGITGAQSEKKRTRPTSACHMLSFSPRHFQDIM